MCSSDLSVLNELPILSVEELIERIDAVDLGALRELSGDLFAPRGLSVVGVGPHEEAFRAAIAPLQDTSAQGEGAGENGEPDELAAQAARG